MKIDIPESGIIRSEGEDFLDSGCAKFPSSTTPERETLGESPTGTPAPSPSCPAPLFLLPLPFIRSRGKQQCQFRLTLILEKQKTLGCREKVLKNDNKDKKLNKNKRRVTKQELLAVPESAWKGKVCSLFMHSKSTDGIREQRVPLLERMKPGLITCGRNTAKPWAWYSVR